MGGLPRRDARPVRHPARAAARRPDATPRSTARSRALVPTGRPGRGLMHGKLHFLAALPRIDGAPAPSTTLGDGVEDLVKRVNAAWTGPPGPKLRLLPDPDHARRRERPRPPAPTTDGCCSASTRRTSAPVGLDLDAEPAPADLRRRPVRQERAAALLRARGRSAPAPEEAQLFVVDYRRVAARRGARGVPAQLPHLRDPGRAGDQGPRGVPRDPHPRPRRHPRAAAQPVVVEGRRGLRPRRRLRPGRHPAGLPLAPARSRCSPRPATSACTSSSPGARAAPRGRIYETGDPVAARPGQPGMLLAARPERARCSGSCGRFPRCPAGPGCSRGTATTWSRSAGPPPSTAPSSVRALRPSLPTTAHVVRSIRTFRMDARYFSPRAQLLAEPWGPGPGPPRTNRATADEGAGMPSALGIPAPA